MPTKHVLAIDFGTANSYYSKCPGDKCIPTGVDFGDGKDGIATAILYRTGKPPLIGDTALDEFGGRQDEDGYILRTQFKPEIATSDTAKKYAIDFLAAVLELASQQQLDIAPEGRQVIFGIPSEADVEYRNALEVVARQAGYGNITVKDEPKGALFYHVFRKDIPVQDAQKGILIVDFGGGTCDFAFMLRGKVRRSWGDMQLGGRVFDDLFFQWFVSQNPLAAASLQEAGDEYYVHSYLCRRTKELFSQTMARDRNQVVSKVLGQYGRLTDMTWDEFVQRATSYTPSTVLMRFLADIGRDKLLMESGSPCDLLAWFSRCLTDGLRNAKVETSDIHLVFLTGGSSQWPFVADILEERLFIERKQIKRSDKPYAAISEGLAILPALQLTFENAKQQLEGELPGFRDTELQPLLEERIEGVVHDTAETIAQELFDKQLRPILKGFRSAGGSVASLKKQLAGQVVAFEPELRQLVQKDMAEFVTGLIADVRELTAKWFDKHGLVSPEHDMDRDYVPIDMRSIEVPVGPVYRPIMAAVLGTIGTVTAVIVAEICGGGGMALIMAGPVGWIIGLILGLVVAFLAVTYGRQKAEEMAEEWSVPKFVLKSIITDRKLSSLRTRIVADVKKTISDNLTDMHQKLDDAICELVQEEIEALNEINVF